MSAIEAKPSSKSDARPAPVNGARPAPVNGNGHPPEQSLVTVGSALPLAANDPALSNYEEAIRTLRNSILLTAFDRRLRSVLECSAAANFLARRRSSNG